MSIRDWLKRPSKKVNHHVEKVETKQQEISKDLREIRKATDRLDDLLRGMTEMPDFDHRQKQRQ